MLSWAKVCYGYFCLFGRVGYQRIYHATQWTSEAQIRFRVQEARNYTIHVQGIAHKLSAFRTFRASDIHGTRLGPSALIGDANINTASEVVAFCRGLLRM